MVREAIISAATLAGLVGLACLYNNGAGNSVDRARRGAEVLEEEIISLTEEVNDTNLDFLTDMGWLEAGADVPEEVAEDVKMYQGIDGEGKAGGAKKQIAQVKNCMRSEKCILKAQQAVGRWSKNSKQYITANPSRLLKPVNTGYAETGEESDFAGSDVSADFGLCTPNDDAVPCVDGQDVLFHYNANNNADPKNQWSANAAVQAQIDGMADSSAMQAAVQAHKADNPRAEGNVFKRRAAKIFLVVPNGTPVSMPQSYTFRYGNYWRWFKAFNTKYIGVGTPGGANRVNFHFWFLRQDKNLKMIMKNPAKSSNRFPWRRFDSLMMSAQNTAAQPKIAPTIQQIWETVESKGMAAEFNQGQDCFTMWFHQYVPNDVLDLSDSMFQEDYMKKLDSACTVIHIWVGFQENEHDESAVRVIHYLQGLLQPTQLSTTSADPQRRRWYFVDSLQSLAGPQGDNLMDQIYNDIAFERSRATCLTATSGTDLGAAFEAANDRYDEYYGYGDSTSTTAGAYGATTNYAPEYELGYDDATTAAAYAAGDETTADNSVPDYRCCGIGYGAKKYDANVEACCDDGSTATSEADCFLL